MTTHVRTLARLGHVWRDVAQRGRVERDLDEELRAYVALLAAEKMRAGAEADVAHLAALAELGGVESVKALVREQQSRFARWVHETWDRISGPVRLAARYHRSGRSP